MIGIDVRFEDGEFGARAVIIAPWSAALHEEILRRRPEEAG